MNKVHQPRTFPDSNGGIFLGHESLCKRCLWPFSNPQVGSRGQIETCGTKGCLCGPNSPLAGLNTPPVTRSLSVSVVVFCQQVICQQVMFTVVPVISFLRSFVGPGRFLRS